MELHIPQPPCQDVTFIPYINKSYYSIFYFLCSLYLNALFWPIHPFVSILFLTSISSRPCSFAVSLKFNKNKRQNQRHGQQCLRIKPKLRWWSTQRLIQLKNTSLACKMNWILQPKRNFLQVSSTLKTFHQVIESEEPYLQSLGGSGK
jgi:hypothetical protein